MPLPAILASKFKKSVNMRQNFFAKIQYGYEITQNLVLILHSLKKLLKSSLKKAENLCTKY
jgi:hypothetical protein